MGMLTHTKRTTPRQRGRRTKHLFDWMAHAWNLSKGSSMHSRDEMARCSFCGLPETQQHINVACTYPPLAELRHSHWRHVDELFLTYRHQNLPSGHRWIATILDYIEVHLWDDTELGGDIWNGRWTPIVFERLLPISPNQCTPLADVRPTLKWLQRLTLLLQRAQREIYSARHVELLSKEAQVRRNQITALRPQHRSNRAQTLCEAWRLPYFKPSLPRRRFAPPLPAQIPLHLPVHQRWQQYSRAVKSATTALGSHSLAVTPPTHPPTNKTSVKRIGLRNWNYASYVTF